MGGCSAFEKEYVVVTAYKNSSPEDAAPDFDDIATYSQLQKALSSMVSARVERAALRFARYGGSLQEDLSAACWSIRAESAMGAWCVESMSSALRQDTDCDEAVVTIRYKRTAGEMENLVRLTGTLKLSETVQAALESAQPHLTLRLSSGVMDGDTALEAVRNAWYDNPVCSPVPPQADVQVYSGESLEKIVDISFSYDYTPEQMKRMRDSLSQAADRLLQNIPAGSPEVQALHACTQLNAACRYAGEAGLADTAYGALVLGKANSLGYAQAYKLLCDRLEIPCRIISGRYDREAHDWNIIELYGFCYHTDVSLAPANGMDLSFLRSDSDMWGRYWWLINDYQTCDGPLSHGAVAGYEASPDA